MYTFITENPTMVDAYWNIFNSMAALFSNTVYLNLLKLAFTLGGFFVFFNGIINSFKGSDYAAAPRDFFKYMVVGTVLLSIIFSHKSELLVKTEHISSYCPTGTAMSRSLVSSDPVTTGTVIGNIPTVLAWGFNFLNELGLNTTGLAKQAFSSTMTTSTNNRSDYISFLNGVNDIMNVSLNSLGSNLSFGGQKASLGEVFTLIMNDCVYIPASSDNIVGEKALNAVKSTGNTLETVHDLIVNGVISIYKNPTNTTPIIIDTAIKFNGTEPKNLLTNFFGNTYTCENAWTEFRTKYTELRNSQAVECNGDLKDTLSPITLIALTGDQNATLAMGKDIVMNAGLANQLLNSQRNLAIGEIDYASGKSMSEMAYKSVGTGYNIAEMIPYLQMGMRAVLYAFFPFVFVVILMPGGIKVLVSYLQTLLWVELWSPIAAILNMFLSYSSTKKFQSMYQSEGLNVLNGVQTFSDAYMLAGVAGYLYAMIPAIAWLILKQSGELMAGIGSKLASIMENNMNSKTINEDMSSRAMNKSINAERMEKGLKTISMAEQDYMASNYAAQQEAGKFSANESKKDLLMSAAAGKTLNDIASGKGMSDYFNADKNNFNKAIAGTRIDKEVKAEVNSRTGQTDLKGDFNKTGVDKIISSRSNELNALFSKNQELYGNGSTADQLNMAKKIGKTAGIVASMSSETDREYLKSVGVIEENGSINQEQFNKVIKTDSNVKEIVQKTNQQVQEQFGVEKLVDTGVAEKTMGVETTDAQKNMIEATTGKKLSEGGAKTYATIKAASEGLNWKADQNFLKRIGINESTSPAEVNKKLEGSANTMGEKRDRELSLEEAFQQNISKEEQIESFVNQEVKSTTEGLNIPNVVNIQSEILKREGVNVGDTLKEKITAINSAGVAGDIFNKLQSDQETDMTFSAGLKSEHIAANKISKNIKEYTKLTSMFEEYSDNKSIVGEKHEKYLEEAKEKIGIKGDNEELGEIDSILVASATTGLLQSKTESFNNVKNNKATSRKSELVTAKEIGTSGAVNKAIKATQQGLYQNFVEPVAAIQRTNEIISMAKTFATTLTNSAALFTGIAEQDKYKAALKDQEDLKKEIVALKNKKNKSEEEENKLRRLITKKLPKVTKAVNNSKKELRSINGGKIREQLAKLDSVLGTNIAEKSKKLSKSVSKAKSAANVLGGTAMKVLAVSNTVDNITYFQENIAAIAKQAKNDINKISENNTMTETQKTGEQIKIISNAIVEADPTGSVIAAPVAVAASFIDATVAGVDKEQKAQILKEVIKQITGNDLNSIEEKAINDHYGISFGQVSLTGVLTKNIDNSADEIANTSRVFNILSESAQENKTGVIAIMGLDSGNKLEFMRNEKDSYSIVVHTEIATYKTDLKGVMDSNIGSKEFKDSINHEKSNFMLQELKNLEYGGTQKEREITSEKLSEFFNLSKDSTLLDIFVNHEKINANHKLEELAERTKFIIQTAEYELDNI